MASPTVVSAQARSARATIAWSPPSSGVMYTRPWRSSPLTGPVFSTLPPVIPETSEEQQENDLDADGARELPRTRSPSPASQAGSLTASGYGSKNASGSALALAEGEASTSSVSLSPSTTLVHGTSSSQGHGSSQSHSLRPSHLSKSWGRRISLPVTDDFRPPEGLRDMLISPPPRARTLSHGHSRSVSFPNQLLVPSPTIPPAYSPHSRILPDSEGNTGKQPPSKSRDPASNWMSTSPFGPAQTPKFSRLAMASPAVVMPLSAKEYRKQKARESVGKEKEKVLPASSNRVTFIDNALSAFPSPNGVPVVKVFPPQSEDDPQAPSSSGDHGSDRRSRPQHQAGHSPTKPRSPASMSPRSLSPKLRRPRSRPNTPPRSSPLAAHPPISPKSSSGTFFSAVSGSDDDTAPPARPRPRLRRKSYPDRLSNGHRLSLLEAMNRLSQETSQHRLSQPDGVNRLSVMSQASGHTLFYDVGESEGDKCQVTSGHGNVSGHADEGGQRTPVMHTQSLEDLSSTLARTGIEAVRPGVGGHVSAQSEDERREKRNVRTVRISDIIEVSPPPATRRRRLTKSRPRLARGSASVSEVAGNRPAKDVKPQAQERRMSLLPWKAKGSGDSKAGIPGTGSGASFIEGDALISTIPVQPSGTATLVPVPRPPSPIANGSTHVKSHSSPNSNGTPSKRASSGAPAAASSPDLGSFRLSSKSRRYTFSFLPSATFHRAKREKSHTAPPRVDPVLVPNTMSKPKGGVIATERSGTDSTSTSIRTITQGSQSTLVPSSPGLDDPITSTSSGSLSARGSSSSVPMLRRLNAQEMSTSVPSPSECEGKGDSTPSLVTNASTATSSSSPRTPSYLRPSGEPFVPRPSGLKESFTDTSEDSEDAFGVGRTSKCIHWRHEPSPLARVGAGVGEASDDDERRLHPDNGPRLGSRPGTSSSSVTTATEASGSYLSFSTVPASTASSSASTSRSESPSQASDKLEQVISVLQGGDGDKDVHRCALCGHQSTTPVLSRSLSYSATYDPGLEGMHPMFTVPLVTVPVSVLNAYARSSSNVPSAVPRYAGGRRRERRVSASVPATATATVAANVSVLPARSNQNLHHTPVNAGGVPVGTSTKARMTTTAMGIDDKTVATTTTIAPLPSPSPVPPPQKVKKRSRPQTAPATTGDAALKFVEEAKAMRAREGGVDFDALIGGARSTKPKARSRESKSKIKTVLKGLLKWGG